MEQADNYSIPSVRRAVAIMKIIAESSEPLGVTELARQLEIPKSSVFRIVWSLEAENVLAKLDGQGFTIGTRAFEIGAAFEPNASLARAFDPVASELVKTHNETVQLAVLSGTEVLYIAKKDSRSPVRLVSDIGSRLPAHVTSLGKAMLAHLSEDQVRKLYEGTELTQATSQSHSSLQKLLEDLAEIQVRGWAIDAEEALEGLYCVGGAITSHDGRPVAAISVAVPSQRVSEERLHELGVIVARAAETIASASDIPR